MRGDRELEALFQPKRRPRQRAAALAAATTVIPALLLIGLAIRLEGLGHTEAMVWLGLLLGGMFLTLPALGVLQMDIRCNPHLRSEAKSRWLALVVMLPGGGAIYGLRHCRASQRSRVRHSTAWQRSRVRESRATRNR